MSAARGIGKLSVQVLLVAIGVLCFGTSAAATTRTLDRAGGGEIAGIVTDGDRYAIWQRLDYRAKLSRVSIFDAVSAKIRRVVLPPGCAMSSASTGLLLVWCEGEEQYVLELSSGRLRRTAASVPGYQNVKIGRRWISGLIRGCYEQDPKADCAYYENRVTGQVVRKPDGKPLYPDLDGPVVRALRSCGKLAPGWYYFHPYMAGDLRLVLDDEQKGSAKGQLQVQRCGHPPTTLDKSGAQDVNVARNLVVWTTDCQNRLDFRSVFKRHCRPLVKAHRMNTGKRTVWRLPDGTVGSEVWVSQVGGWVFAQRVTRRDSSSVGDPYAFALYKARIPG